MEQKTSQAKKKTLPKKPATFLTIDNTNLIGWLMSCFIICGCMFFLGVLVGRNTAPVQFDVDRLEEKLANLQVSVLKHEQSEKPETAEPEIIETADINEIPELPIVHEDIIDHLKDKGKELEIYEQYVPPVLKPKYSKTPPPKDMPKQAKKAPASKPEKPVKKTKPPAEPEPVASQKLEIVTKTPTASLPDDKPQNQITEKSLTPPKSIPEKPEIKPADQEFAIQVASLRDAEKARLLMNKFREKGYPAFCQKSQINGTTWHRVRIGPYPERTLADKDRERLKAAGVDSLVISMN